MTTPLKRDQSGIKFILIESIVRQNIGITRESLCEKMGMTIHELAQFMRLCSSHNREVVRRRHAGVTTFYQSKEIADDRVPKKPSKQSRKASLQFNAEEKEWIERANAISVHLPASRAGLAIYQTYGLMG